MDNGNSKENKRFPSGYAFGTFKGVFTPSILTILGVIMYLRFGWALGNVGLPLTLLIVTMASGITFLTGLSLSALATNRKVQGGGAYYIISRSLGVEAGAAVGLPLFFAQALGISFYCAGFSESLVAVSPNLIPQCTAALGLSAPLAEYCNGHAALIVGIVTLLLLTAIAYISADLALRTQFVVMTLIGLSLVSFFLGGAPTTDAGSATTIPATSGFWVVFAVIFPAVTGIEAGIAMSGDLKDPAKSLPRGTITAVLFGYLVYIALCVFLWFSITDKTRLLDPMVTSYVARWGSFVVLGVWAASLSSAMGALLGAPRTLQALARDRVVPRTFGRGFGKGNDPRIATATAFVIGLFGILLGNLNVIAPVLSMFFLTSYGLLNISAALEELARPPSWRPKFRIPWGVSLVGAFSCFAAMFMINAGATFMAAFVAIGVYIAMERRKLKAHWGDVRTAMYMLIARQAIHVLARRKMDTRTWRPNILVLSGSPTSRWYLVELASAISQEQGFLTVATVVPRDTSSERLESMTRTIREYLDKRDVSAVVKLLPAETPFEGAQMLVRAYGYGPVRPNTILLGETEQPENYRPYAELIRMACGQRQNLVIVREAEEQRETREQTRVDMWWYGTQQNLGLMLALVHLLQLSPAWRRTALILKTIVAKPEDQAESRKRLEGFIKKVRIRAQAEVLVRSSENIFEDIQRHSQGADLVFLGMRTPADDETLESYGAYYRELLMNTDGLPPTALVLAAETMDYYAIFADD